MSSSDAAGTTTRSEPSSTAAPSVGSPESPGPKRVMGFVDLVLFYVVTGISLRWIATAASAGPSAVVIWIAAWLLFYSPLALSVIELSSRYPHEGGLYVWSKQAFGDFAGFICAWIYWTSNLPYFPTVLYFAASNVLYMRGSHWNHLSNNPAFYIVFSSVTLILITLMNIVGLNVGKWLHNVGAFAMWMPVAIIIAMGSVAIHRFGSATAFTARDMLPSIHLKDMIFWSSLMYAFGGCETASFMSGEIRNTRRSIPWAVCIAGVAVTVAYVWGTIAVLWALPNTQVSDLQGLMQALTTTANRIGLFRIIPISAALIALSNLGSAGGYLASVARLPFVAGIDRFLPPVFGRLHPRWKSPYIALIVQCACGLVFVFLGQAGTSVKGAYDVLVSLSIITYFLPYLFLFAAMFRLQRKVPGPPVIRVPGGKPVAQMLAMVGFTTSLLAVALSFFPAPGETHPKLAMAKVSAGTLVLITIGAVLYQVGRKRAGPAP